MQKLGRPTIADARFKLLPAMRDFRVDDYASFIQDQGDLLIGPTLATAVTPRPRLSLAALAARELRVVLLEYILVVSTTVHP